MYEDVKNFINKRQNCKEIRSFCNSFNHDKLVDYPWYRLPLGNIYNCEYLFYMLNMCTVHQLRSFHLNFYQIPRFQFVYQDVFIPFFSSPKKVRFLFY